MALAAPQPQPRRRFSPEMRQSLILDCTAEIVAREGVAAITMDRIGREAGVSKSLVYAYYPNLTALLRALYQREMRRLRRSQVDATQGAQGFDALVRAITHAYLTYINERGLIIHRLQAEPSVSESLNPTDFDRETAVGFLTDIVARHFDLPHPIARAATDLSFGLPAAAGAYLSRNDLDLQTLEDMTVAMVIGSVTAVKADLVAKGRAAG